MSDRSTETVYYMYQLVHVAIGGALQMWRATSLRKCILILDEFKIYYLRRECDGNG